MHKILIVDDEPQVAKSLSRLLTRRGFGVEMAFTGKEALDKVQGFSPDVVISDFRMPGMNGAEFLAQVKTRAPEALRFILSGCADFDSVIASVNEGEICRFLRKPWDGEELVAVLHKMLEGRELLAKLSGPFRAGSPAVTTDSRLEDSQAVVKAHLSGAPFPAGDALAIIARFIGAIEEGELRVIGGLLERNSGKITFVAEVGGEQRLTLEVPMPSANVDGERSV